MTRIYLICAAQSEGEPYRFAEGHYESDLTGRGRLQAAALAERFAGKDGAVIDAVFTSDLYRARATAAGLTEANGPALSILEDLRDICLGPWEGQPWGNIEYRESEQLGRFRATLDRWSLEGAETPNAVVGRMKNTLGKIAAEQSGGSVAAVSHKLPIRLLLADLQGIPLAQVHRIPPVRNASVSVIETEGGLLRLVSQNDTFHLRGEDLQSPVPDPDNDLYLHPLPWLEYSEILAEAVECVWDESGEDRPFHKATLLEDAALLPTTVGFIRQEPAGFLQMGMEPGWITLLCAHPGCRRVGLGTQLIGRAVRDTRAAGGDRLRIAPPKNNPYRQFFLNNGFVPAGETGEGREILEKDVSFDPATV